MSYSKYITLFWDFVKYIYIFWQDSSRILLLFFFHLSLTRALGVVIKKCTIITVWVLSWKYNYNRIIVYCLNLLCNPWVWVHCCCTVERSRCGWFRWEDLISILLYPIRFSFFITLVKFCLFNDSPNKYSIPY